MPYSILLVEDEADLRGTLKQLLESSAHSVISAENGADALLLARDSRPDLALSDVDMPGMDGATLCRLLRKRPETRSLPVILLSGKRIKDAEVLAGFEGGADDYVLKPFSFAVLNARIHAVMRRRQAAAPAAARLRRKGLEIDPEGRTAKAHGREIALTRKEFDLLSALAGKAGRVLSVPYLLETVWGYDPAVYNDPHTVEVHVSQLRRKLGPKLGKSLVAMTGCGYKFQD
jgi:DNA-binding response OmpR family regulator